jgi:alkylhydroperoxidase family enzyme
MRIQPLEKDQAAESIRPVYDTLEKKTGRVINMFKVMAHTPDVLAPFLEFYQKVWAASALSPKIKELAYLRTSLMNGCEY